MYSILIIEDDPSYRSTMQMFLQLEGFEVRTAADGESGIALLREQRPDLILCDILMPGMDGHCVLAALKSEISLANIPFVFVTAMAERTEIRRGMVAGADDYLSKPFTTEELLAAVTSRIHRIEVICSHRASPFLEEQAILRTQVTKREREVLLMVGQGDKSRKIAERLGISMNTVEIHRANLMSKLDAPNAASLARWAVIVEQME